MSAAELARQLKVPTNRITHILNGQRAITGDTALRLGHFFGTAAEFWLNLQKIYVLRVAEHESGADIKGLPRLRDRAGARSLPFQSVYAAISARAAFAAPCTGPSAPMVTRVR